MKSLIFSILFGIISLSIYNYINYCDKKESHTYICYKKYNTSDKNGNMYFYMVLKSESNYMFNLRVNPGTYFSINEQSDVVFTLRKSVFDPNYNTLKITILNLLLILSIVALAISVSVLIVNTFFSGLDNESDW